MNAIVSNFKTKNQRLVICSSADGIPETLASIELKKKEEEKKIIDCMARYHVQAFVK